MTSEGTFKASDGTPFYERRWEPDDPAKANLVLLHGYGEHCNRYAHVAGVFNRAGIAVHTYDQRGFGRSPGKRAYIRDFNVLLLDLDAYLVQLRPRLAGKPWLLMGHSMGGLVLASYVETRQIDPRGLIFSSAFLGFNDDVPAFLLSVANVLGTLTPWLPVGGVDNSGLSRDPQAVALADSDPLCFHGRVRARTGAQFNAAITRARAAFAAITAPVYVIHGSCDKIVPYTGSRELYDRCGSADKTIKIYEGGFHELWNDLDQQAVLDGICKWIAARL